MRTGKRDEALADETDRTVAWRGRTVDRAHPPRPGDGRRRHRRVEHRDRHRGAAPPRPGRLRTPAARGAGPRAPAATSRCWSPTPPAAPGAPGRPTSRSAPPGSTCSRTTPAAPTRTATSSRSPPPRSPTSSPPPPTWSSASSTAGPPPSCAGMSGLVLAPGRHGPGAAALVRDEAQDMFGLGAREAVLSALHADDQRGFGARVHGRSSSSCSSPRSPRTPPRCGLRTAR